MTDHATNVLYPKIKRAMGLLEQLPAGESAILDEAYNALHDAYWSETPPGEPGLKLPGSGAAGRNDGKRSGAVGGADGAAVPGLPGQR